MGHLLCCKVKKTFLLVKKYVTLQPLSSLLVLVIWVVCLVPIPDTPLNGVAFFDKWTHLVMYGSLVAVIMAEYGKRKKTVKWERLLSVGLLLAIAMGGAIEIVQAYFTNGVRSGDWVDFFANSAGAVLGSVIGIPLARYFSIRNRDASP